MRILIELPTWLGDAVMASTAVEAVAKHAAAFDAGNLAGKFEDLSERDFSFSSQNFGSVTQEIQIFKNDTPMSLSKSYFSARLRRANFLRLTQTASALSLTAAKRLNLGSGGYFGRLESLANLTRRLALEARLRVKFYFLERGRSENLFFKRAKTARIRCKNT